MGKPVCYNEGCDNPVKVTVCKNGKIKARRFCSESCRADDKGRRNFYAKGGEGEYSRQVRVYDHELKDRILEKDYDGRCGTCGCRVLGVEYCSDTCERGKITDTMFRARPDPESSQYLILMSESDRVARNRTKSRPRRVDHNE